MSEEEVEAADDSLDIKPPQAKVSQSSKLKRKEHGEKSRHKKSSDKHREERHIHRDKHYRDKQMRSKEYYSKEKDKERYYREKTSYDQLMSESQQFLKEKSHRERKEERGRYSDSRKHEVKESREVRYVSRENEKHRHRPDEEKRGDRTLHDLRERLLNKRKVDDDIGYERRHNKDSHRSHKRRRHVEGITNALEGESGMYVKEIISISGSEERTKTKKEEKKEHLSEKEKAEQDQRREKLLEAGKSITLVSRRNNQQLSLCFEFHSMFSLTMSFSYLSNFNFRFFLY